MIETELDLNFDQLSKETFDICKDIRGDNPFSDLKANTSYPNNPGLIFRIEAGTNTFCIRTLAVESISHYFETNQSVLPRSIKQLRLFENEEVTLYHFETPSIEVAEVLCDQLSNRRFPYVDDDLFNLSDPGHNWWLELSQTSFTLFFKGHQTKCNLGRSVKLGPLGDHMVAHAILTSSKELLLSSLNLKSVEIGDRFFCVSSDGSNPLFGALTNLLLSGEDPTNRQEFHYDKIGITLYYFFQELAYLRRFWLMIEKEIQLKTNRFCQ